MKTIVVCGYHRSGTSMTMQALVRAGLPTSNYLLGIHPTNDDGHFESANIVAFHERQLNRSGTDWMAEALYDQPKNVSVDEEFNLQAEVTSHPNAPCWGFKDPRASVFLDYWKSLLPSMTVVIVVRHYMECISSLRKRALSNFITEVCTDTRDSKSWVEPDACLRSWIVYNRSLLKYYEKNSEHCIVIKHSDLVDGFPLVSEINKLGGFDLNENVSTNIRKSPIKPKLLIGVDNVSSDLVEEAEMLLREITGPEYGEIRNTCKRGTVSFDMKSWEEDFRNVMSVIGFDIFLESTTLELPVEKPIFKEGDILAYRSDVRKTMGLDCKELLKELMNIDLPSKSRLELDILCVEMSSRQNNVESLLGLKSNLVNYDKEQPYRSFVEGVVHESEQQYFLAECSYKAALSLSSAALNQESLLSVLRVMQKQGKAEAALIELEKWLAVNRLSSLLANRKIDLLIDISQLQDAMMCFKEAITNWPTNPSLYFQRYKIARKRSENETAKVALTLYKYYQIKNNKEYYDNLTNFVNSLNSAEEKQIFTKSIMQEFNEMAIVMKNYSVVDCI